jgi:thiol-disulfide isomerase/thioredoxin
VTASAAREALRLPGRIGLALVAPRWAHAVAADRRAAGRSGSDLIGLLALVVVAVQLRELVTAAWVGAAISAELGLRLVLGLLSGALVAELAFLVVAALVLWVAGGPRRDLGRAFDLACVAAIPLLVLALARTAGAHLAGGELPAIVDGVARAAGWAWNGALVALALRTARSPATGTPPIVPSAIARWARRAGRAVLAGAAAALVLDAAWIARHLESVRPAQEGSVAPPYALPRIEAGGSLGAPVTRAPGRVTVLDFWATWCGPCLTALPKLHALAAARRGDGVDVVAVNLDDPAEARRIFDARGWTAIDLVADRGGAAQRYAVSALPHTVVIDRDGLVRLTAQGVSPGLDAAVARAVARPRGPP